MAKKHNIYEKLWIISIGVQMIDWLLKWCFVPDREQGVALCNILLEEAHLQPIGMTSKNSFKRKGRNHKAAFVDESDALYRFVSRFEQSFHGNNITVVTNVY